MPRGGVCGGEVRGVHSAPPPFLLCRGASPRPGGLLQVHLPPPTSHLAPVFFLSLSSPDANHPPHRSPPNFSDFTPHPWCRVFGMTAGVRRTHQRVVHSVSMVGGGLTLLHQGKVGKGASWCMVLGAWCMVHGVWCKELWCMVPQVEASCSSLLAAEEE